MLRLEGKIAGPWTNELQRTWVGLAPSIGSKKLAVDLRRISYVDEVGRGILTDMGRSHAEFLADSPLTKYFAEEAMRVPRANK